MGPSESRLAWQFVPARRPDAPILTADRAEPPIHVARRHAHADFESFRVAIGFNNVRQTREGCGTCSTTRCGELRAVARSYVPAAHVVIATVVFVIDRGIHVVAFLQSLYEFNLVLVNSTGPDTSRKLKRYFDGIILEIEISLS